MNYTKLSRPGVFNLAQDLGRLRTAPKGHIIPPRPKMRVIGGTLRGRRLRGPSGQSVRPTSDRVRESVFQILGDFTGARILDLFCGTGALGIEALSRGAEHATFVDRDDRMLALCRKNLAELNLPARSLLVRADLLRHFPARLEGPYDIIFADPPYRFHEDKAEDLSRLLGRSLREAAPGGTLILEGPAKTTFGLPDTQPADVRVYGGTAIRFYGPVMR